MILTPISALQLLSGKATDDSQWWTPHVHRKPWRVFDWNSGHHPRPVLLVCHK